MTTGINYSSSPVLFTDLYEDGISTCVTVWGNQKGLPKQELKAQLGGESM